MATENVTPPASPPQMALYQMAAGDYLSRAICLAAKLKIADLLKDGPRHFGDLAQATGTDAASLNRVMRLLASAGVFEAAEDGNFTLTSLGECLREGVPGSARALVMMFAGNWLQDAWKDLEYSVELASPPFATEGSTISSQSSRRIPKKRPTSTQRWPISRGLSRLWWPPLTISVRCGHWWMWAAGTVHS